MTGFECLPKIRLGQFPTPLYRLQNLSRYFEREIFIKRDDLSGVSLGGNKVRKLEYLLADALQKHATVVLTTGGAQSNHAMLTAACANMLGLKSVLVLKKRGVSEHVGNQLLNDILHTDVHFVDADDYSEVYAEMDRISRELESRGETCYSIPVGGSVPLGVIGYADAVHEIMSQDARLSRIVCATGSGGMNAGVALGAKLFMPEVKVTGVMVDDEPFHRIVPELVRGALKLIGNDMPFSDDEIDLISMVGPGYAKPSKEGEHAIRLMGEKEGLILDPVYSGKAFAGLVRMIDEGIIQKDEPVLFIHSGGAGGLFAIGLS